MFHNIKTWHTTVNYDNQDAINMSERNLRSIQTSSNCADILWNLLNTRNMMSTTLKYQHEDGCMDKYVIW